MEFDDMEESYFAFLNNAKKVLGDPSYEQTMREIAAAGEGGGRMRARNTGTSIPPVTSTSPGHSPSGTPASAMSPIHRTPTNKTPPGNNTSPNKLMTANSPTTGQFPNPLLAVRPTPPPMQAMSAHSSPGISSQPQIPLSSQSASGMPKNSAANSASKPAQKPLLPWVLLAIFLLVAVGLLVFVLAKK